MATAAVLAAAGWCALVLSAAPASWAAGTAHGHLASGAAHHLSSTPPIPLGAHTRSSATHAATSHGTTVASEVVADTRLPATGYDAFAVALLGVGLLGAGLGLRRLSCADGRRT